MRPARDSAELGRATSWSAEALASEGGSPPYAIARLGSLSS
jgi:hypothetical protein